MITLPASMEKGQLLTFALAKSQLLSIVPDPYWSTLANIAKAHLVYGSKAGNQKKRLTFNFSEDVPLARVEWSVRAREEFAIKSITLVDQDGDTYNLPENLIPAGKDVNFVVIMAEHFRPDADLTAIETDGTNLFVAGHSMTRMTVASDSMSEFNLATGANTATDFYSRFPAFNGTVSTLCFSDPDTLWVGGAFTTMNGRTRNRIAKLIRQNGAWIPEPSFDTGTASFGVNGIVHKLISHGDSIFILGEQTQYTSPSGVATNINHVVKIGVDGTRNALFNINSANNRLASRAISGLISGQSIYIAGSLHIGANSSTRNIGRHDINTGALISDWPVVTQQGFSSNVSWGSSVYALALHDNHLYIGGDLPFGLVTGSVTSTGGNLFRIHSETGVLDTNFSHGIPFNLNKPWDVRAIHFDSDGALIVAGKWRGTNQFPSSMTQNIVSLDATTGARLAGELAPNASGSGSAAHLALMASDIDPIVTGRPSDSYSFSVENGVMTLTYSKSIVHTENSAGTGYYEIPLPPGYDFATSVNRVTNFLVTTLSSPAGDVNTGLGDLLGTGKLNALDIDVRPGPKGLMVRISSGAVRRRWWSTLDGNVATLSSEVSFTATIPVVRRFNPTRAVSHELSEVRGIIPVGDEMILVGTFRAPSTTTGLSTGQKTFGAIRMNRFGEAVGTFRDNQESTVTLQTDVHLAGVIDGNRLITGGSQTYANAYLKPSIAKLTKDARGYWRINPAFSSGAFNGAINSMLVNNGKLYLAGAFTTIGGVTRNRVAAIDASTGALDTFFANGVFNAANTSGRFAGVSGGTAPKRIRMDGQNLVIAGGFSSVVLRQSGGGQTTAPVQRWIRVDTTTNTESIPAGPGDGEINDFVVGTESIWAVGTFSNWAGVSKPHCVRVNALNGALESSFSIPSLATPAGSTTITPNAIELIGDKLLIVTNATSVGGAASQSGTFTVDWLTGNLSKSFSQVEMPILIESFITVDSDHIYIGGSNNITGTAPFLSAIKRLTKATFQPAIYGFSGSNVGFKPKGIALIGSELLFVGAAHAATPLTFPGQAVPHTKKLYAWEKATGSRRHTI